MIVCIPELNSKTIQSAIKEFPHLTFIPANDLADGCAKVNSAAADTMLSGLDYSSRSVLLAFQKNFSLSSRFFSSSFVCEKGSKHFVLADGGVNKLPSKEQLLTITEDSAKTFESYYDEQPRIALLSYSTNGSGGKNPDLEKFAYVIKHIRQRHPGWLIDGEMQLDAAVDPRISAKKFPDSTVQGNANVLIAPDLNSGNLLYKSLEQFAGFTIAGPLIQGFSRPLADLSRGSSVKDVVLTLRVLQKLCSTSNSTGVKTT